MQLTTSELSVIAKTTYNYEINGKPNTVIAKQKAVQKGKARNATHDDT